MSDLMLLGVLRMPLDTTSDLMMEQFINRARQVADRIESDAEQIDRERSYSAAMEARVSELEGQLERAQTQVSEFEQLMSGSSKAWLLRRQAEAVEAFADWADPHWPKSLAAGIKDDAKSYAHELRTQADELEKAGGGQ